MPEYVIYDPKTRRIVKTGTSSNPNSERKRGQRIIIGRRCDDPNMLVEPETEEFYPSSEIDASDLLPMIKRECNRRLSLGRVIDGVHITATDGDRATLLGLARKADNLPLELQDKPSILFRDASNKEHLLTPRQTSQLADASVDLASELRMASWRLKKMRPPPQNINDDQWWS